MVIVWRPIFIILLFIIVLWRDLNCVKIPQGQANKSANRWGNLRAKGGVVLGCPRNKLKEIFVQTETNRNKICFAFVSVCFVKTKRKNFGLFRRFEPILKQPKQIDLFRNKPKEP
jgi:hypothetical protein